LQFKWLKVDYRWELGDDAFDVTHVLQQLHAQLLDIPLPPPDSSATHALVTGA
jgi:hypothetical protein